MKDCKLCTGLLEDYRHYIVDLIYNGDWVVESVDCDNDVDMLSGRVVQRYVTIRLKGRYHND